MLALAPDVSVSTRLRCLAYIKVPLSTNLILSTHVKSLGVIFDPKLSFDSHMVVAGLVNC